ncbi:hypothetical protein SLS57_003893 [Botryosphaeria dothidea]
MHATSKGYGKVVKALFDTGKVAGLEALRVSVEKQDCHIAKTILETGQVRLHSAEQAESPHLLLHAAVEKGSEGMIRLLLNDKAPPDEKYNSGWTPLCVAVDKGFDKIVKLLVQTGEVDLDYRYPGRHSHYLKFKARLNWAHHADEEIPEALSQAQEWGGYPLLCVAAEKGYSATMKVLLEDGKVDANVRHPDSRSMLHIAADEGIDEICEFLLSVGADPDLETKLQWRPLGCAAKWGRVSIVKMLLATGNVDLNFENGNRRRIALELAEREQHYKIAEILRAAAAERAKSGDPSGSESVGKPQD